MESNKVNKFLSNVLNNYLQKSEYSLINNIVTYSNSVEEELIKSFQFEYESIINGYECKKHNDDGSIKGFQFSDVAEAILVGN
jgi:hypothetical protein